MTSAWSGHQQNASGEEIESGPAEHLALQHLQAVDVPFDGALTPRQRHCCLDSSVILTQAFGQAPEGRERAGGRARQPCIELGRLALADEGGEVLGERHGFRQLGRLRGQLRQLVVSLRRRPLCWTKGQPGGLTRGKPAVWRLRHHRQRLIAPALPGRQSLRLAHAPDIQGHHARLAPNALATDGPEARRAIPTATIPPGQEGRLVRIEEAAVAAMPGLALGKRRALQIPRHGAPTEAHRRRDGVQRPPLLMRRPDLVLLGPPSGAPLAG
jgi:hypothetical protein